jgi:hypothetical protein
MHSRVYGKGAEKEKRRRKSKAKEDPGVAATHMYEQTSVRTRKHHRRSQNAESAPTSSRPIKVCSSTAPPNRKAQACSTPDCQPTIMGYACRASAMAVPHLFPPSTYSPHAETLPSAGILNSFVQCTPLLITCGQLLWTEEFGMSWYSVVGAKCVNMLPTAINVSESSTGTFPAKFKCT